jgi:hypothetical protein
MEFMFACFPQSNQQVAIILKQAYAAGLTVVHELFLLSLHFSIFIECYFRIIDLSVLFRKKRFNSPFRVITSFQFLLIQLIHPKDNHKLQD